MSNRLRILDQTRLPQEEIYVETSDYHEIANAIVELKVRGAPAIGVAAAYAVALGALNIKDRSEKASRDKLQQVMDTIRATRPTARNLFWALERMARVASQIPDFEKVKTALVAEASAIHREETEYSRLISQNGFDIINDSETVLTHCNTGALATTGYGTALGIIVYAFQHGKKIKVMVDETRPLLQGSRLTTWELQKASVPFTLITDSMAGYFMSKGDIDCVIVGADRIAVNGDTANKIGTCSIAILAKAHGIPFYIAAPTSTIDRSIESGREITIEQRNPDEVTHIHGISIAPDGTSAANPAFDVTPAKYITAIISERGIIRKPYKRNILAALA